MPETVTHRSAHEIGVEIEHVETELHSLARRIAELAAYGFALDRDEADAIAYRAANNRKSALYDEMGAIGTTALALSGSTRG